MVKKALTLLTAAAIIISALSILPASAAESSETQAAAQQSSIENGSPALGDNGAPQEKESEDDNAGNPPIESGSAPVEATTEENSNTKTGVLIGDANSDGEVNVNDATLIQRYLAESPVAAIDLDAADVNRSNTVEMQDVTIIQRFLAEYIHDFSEWDPQIKELVLSETEITLDVGEQHALTTNYSESDGSVTFSSGNPNVASVDENGLITAADEGVADITALTNKGLTAVCTVTVNKPVYKELVLSESEVLLGIGEQLALTTNYSESDGSVTFSSDNPNVASVDENGLITATGEGVTEITAVTDRGLSAVCAVTAGKAISNITLNKTELTLAIGEVFKLSANTPDGEVSHSIGFSSGNPNVASIDENGLITAKGTGTAAVVYKAYNGKFASCTVTVMPAATSISLNKTSLLLQPNEQFDLNSYIPKGQAAYYRSYSTSDSKVADVTVSGGIVTAVSEGQAVITVTTTNGVSTSCVVMVAVPPKKVSVNLSTLILGAGETYTLRAVYDGSKTGYGATFSSNNMSVLAVDSKTGVLTAKHTGYATVTVTSFNNISAKCYVTVKKAPSSVTFNNNTVPMIKGEQVQFYLNASKSDEGLYSATYASNNSAVASVTKGGVVTAVSKGTATITATAYNGKKSSVTVNVLDSAGNTVKATTSAIGLRKDSSWKASNIVIIKKGEKVTTFGTSTDGRWVKAKYGNNYGWIYNKALGVTKNYSSISVSTLPAVADDLLFDLNVNLRRIYDYVYDVGYRNSDNDTTENLCVEALKYGRGSCYHHAALINYLFNRCGCETITVVGIDDLTGGSDHAWCLTKTDDGWRHVDAQEIITYSGVFDNTNQYFVTDNHISQFFTWSRSSYPAAE